MAHDLKTVGLVCNSNGQEPKEKERIKELSEVLQGMGLKTVSGSYLFRGENVRSADAKDRAAEMMRMYRIPEVCEIFDVSGGDIANEVLDYLDFARIKQEEKRFWGYSDLTTVINAIYTMTGRSSVLYQVKNLVSDEREIQRENFRKTVIDKTESLFRFSYRFVQGEEMEGVVVGGNIRCFLKLAGTRFFPDLRGKLLFLESLGGETPQMITYLAQLKQMGAFESIEGVLLGTFIQMEKIKGKPDMVSLVREFAGENMPIAITGEIGHRPDSKALRIGHYYSWKER